MSKVVRIRSCVLNVFKSTAWRLDLVILGIASIVVILILSGALADALKPSEPPLLIDSAPYQSTTLDAAR